MDKFLELLLAFLFFFHLLKLIYLVVLIVWSDQSLPFFFVNTQNRLHINILKRKRVFITQLNRPDKSMTGKEKKQKKMRLRKQKLLRRLNNSKQRH